MQIISHSRIEESTEYQLLFGYVTEPGSGYAFPCDPSGNVSTDGLTPAAVANLEACQAGDNRGKLNPPRVITLHNTYRYPAIGRCACGAEIALDAFTNACDCGRDYNSAGQLLAPRAQWGEETGEAWYECL